MTDRGRGRRTHGMAVVRGAALAAGLFLFAVPAPAVAQAGAAIRSGFATRQTLDSLRARMHAYAESPAYSARMQARARERARAIEDRLHEGDFRVGDRVLLTVEREEALTDTFTVRDGRELVLPTVGSIPLDGVLRAELEERVRSEIARYLREPVVRTRTLIRVTITGGVVTPGFYSLPTELPVSEALMRAGGPTPDAELDGIRIEREGRTVWTPERLRPGVIQGRTLDELNLVAGDRIIVPEEGRGLGALESPVRVLSLLLTIPAAIFGVGALFGS